MNDYKKPILSWIFNLLGVLALIGAGVCIAFVIIAVRQSGSDVDVVKGLSAGAVALILAALTYFGVARAIDYLARTAHATSQLCNLMETTVVRQMQSIEARINSSIRLDQPLEDKSRFYYNADGTQEGPFTATEMRDFHESGTITLATQVLRDGDPQWRTFMDFPDLVRL